MASQSFNLIGQEQEQELVAFEIRQSRGPTPQSRPNSRMEEMLSQLIKSQSELIHSHTSTDDKLSQIAYTQIEQIAAGLGGSDIYRWKIAPGQPIHWIGPDSEKFNSSGARLDGQRALHSSFDHPLVTYHGEIQNCQIVQSTTADSGPIT